MNKPAIVGWVVPNGPTWRNGEVWRGWSGGTPARAYVVWFRPDKPDAEKFQLDGPGSRGRLDAFPTLAAFPTLDAAMTAAEMLALCAK